MQAVFVEDVSAVPFDEGWLQDPFSDFPDSINRIDAHNVQWVGIGSIYPAGDGYEWFPTAGYAVLPSTGVLS